MVRPGYQLTEVGEVPSDWEVTRIDAACRLVNGRGFKPYEWQKSGLPIIRIQNLNGSMEFNYFQGRYDPKLEVDDGQLLFAWSGSRGTSFGPHMWKGERGLLNYHTWKVVIDEREVDPEFFFYALRMLTTFIESKAHGASALVHTQKWEMEGYKFARPSESAEQKAIATALSDVDALIESLEALIAKKRAIKTATMQQLLTGKTRLPGFGDGVGTKQTELGEIPDDWEVRTYGNTFEFLSTCSNSRADLSAEGEVEYIHYGDIHTKYHDHIDTSRVILPRIRASKVSSATRLQIGDLVVADASEDYEGIGKSVEVRLSAHTDVVAGLHTFLLRDGGQKYADGFRGYLHKIPAVKAQMDRLATGLKVYGLSKDSLRQIAIPYPPKSEQEQIAAVLEDMQRNIAVAEGHLAKTKALKQGMMQELLTGRTRLV